MENKIFAWSKKDAIATATTYLNSPGHYQVSVERTIQTSNDYAGIEAVLPWVTRISKVRP